MFVNNQKEIVKIIFLRIAIWRTKPLRGRNKSAKEAPLFWLNLVQFGVIVLPLLSFGNLQGKFPDWNPIDSLFCSRSGSVLLVEIVLNFLRCVKDALFIQIPI
jgi:hypothetical protein